MKASSLLFPLLLWGTMAQAKNTSSRLTAEHSLNFIENKGQVIDQYGKSRNDINYRLGGSGLSMFVSKGQLHYQWASPVAQFGEEQQRMALYRMDVTLVGADPQAKVIAEQKQDFYERYYTPQFGEQGAIAHAYQKITYQNVYPNIDWVLYVKDNKVEYDFVVRPGGKVSDIQLHYNGATNIGLDKAGTLTAITPSGSIVEAAPVSHQADGKMIASSFVLNGDKVNFTTGDYTGTLVIDPTLSWSTYYGGSGDDYCATNGVTGDKTNNVYITGYTGSTSNIATVGSYQDTLTGGSGTDAFVAKFNSSGTIQWATYYGGVNNEKVYGITSDTLGKIYIAGYTNSSSSIASTGAYQTTLGTTGSGTDAFLIKFDTSGSRLWGTYFGGTSTDQGLGVTCDITGNVYLTGYTGSTTSIATTGAHQTTLAGSSDAFLAKFTSIGTLLWATYYGGSSVDQGWTIGCDTGKNVYLSGYTQSTGGIATTGAYQTSNGGGKDGFIIKFDSTGSRQWGTYYGGSGSDYGYSIVCDNTNGVYLTGSTTSTASIASVGSYQDTYGGGAGDGFIAKFNNLGSRKWANYYGGAQNDFITAVTYSKLGFLYLTGYAASVDSIATTGTYQDTMAGGADAMLLKFDTAGNRIWATYLGGESVDNGTGIYCNTLSRVFVGGQTSSYSFPTTVGCYQNTNGGGYNDCFMSMFNDCNLTIPSTPIGNDTVCRGASYTYYFPSIAGATSYTWTLPVGWSGSSSTDTIHAVAGTHSDTIKVAANFACGTSVQQTKFIVVSPLPTTAPAGTSGICNGDSITLTASTGTSYQWLQAGFIISGAHSNTYTAHTGNYYSVIVTSTNGCADTSNADTIIVHPTPVPIITASGMTLSTGTYATYQWSHDGTPITGAVNQTYTIVINSGDYTVTVVDSNGCTGTSAAYNPTTGVQYVSNNNSVSLYPNPTADIINIISAKEVDVEITSIDGRRIGTYKQAKVIDLSGFPEGIYILRITDKAGKLLGMDKVLKAKNQ